MSPAKKLKAIRRAAKKAAKPRKRAAKTAKLPRGPDDDYTIPEWCAKRRIYDPPLLRADEARQSPEIDEAEEMQADQSAG